VITGAEALLEDLGSKNGTFVQGEPVSAPVRLANGDEIRTGSVVLRFRMSPPKGATATWSGDERS
jgi:pSer/pThr/pTyr-binding forkhead associated (FHA) protein